MESVIGLGSNLGERRKFLEQAVLGCASLGRILAVSSLYETDPVGPPQPPYLNAALVLRTELDPEGLLDRLLGLERAAGRARAERWGPRTLDLDVLWIAGVTIATDRLVVPHPRLVERDFALVPLLEIVPAAADPLTGASYRERVSAAARSCVRRIAAPEQWLDAKILQSFRD